MEQTEIGARMKAAAEAAGLDPYEIAARLGVRPPTVYRWYQGKTRPANAAMEAFGAAVGQPAAYLWTGVEEVGSLLLRWAELARREGGAAALRALGAGAAGLTDEEMALLDSLAPQMLKLLDRLAGSEWDSLPHEQQQQVLERLMAELQRRPERRPAAG